MRIMNWFNKQVEIRVKKLKLLAKMPVKAHDTDACYDMTATWVNHTDDYIEYGTDIAFDIPKGYVGLIFPRSSVTKEDIILKNSVGVIDARFQGEIRFRFSKLVNGVFREDVTTSSLSGGQTRRVIEMRGVERPLKTYKVGDRVGQIMFIKLPNIKLKLVDNFDKSERGTKGFGSTGK